MNIIPVTILDDFLPNPNAIRDWGLSLELTPNTEGNWPGKRSKPLHELHPPFFYYLNSKVLSLFFEDTTKITYNISLYFQLIENLPGKGWIHQDKDIFTFIIYLHPSNPQIDCGTTLWNLKPDKIHPFNNQKDIENYNYRKEHHLNKPIPPEYQQNFNNNFIKEISVPDKFNRLVAFSSDHFHSANNFNNNLSSRLTLIGFVQNLNTPHLPVLRSKQVSLF